MAGRGAGVLAMARSPRRGMLLLTAAYLLLAAAWLPATPLGGGPDESHHFIKAAALSQGQLRGTDRFMPRPAVASKSDALWQWLQATSRAYWLPARLAGTNPAACYKGRPYQPATCAAATTPPPAAGWYHSYAGLSPPTAYLLPSLPLRRAPNPTAGLWLARLVSALCTAAVLWLALAATVRGDHASHALRLLGLALSITPTAVFLAVVLSSSAIEVAGGICLMAGLLAVVRTRGRPGRLVWAAVGVGGVALAASRPLGPLWLAADLAAVGVLVAPACAVRWLRQAGVVAWAMVAAVALAVVGNLLWQMVMQTPTTATLPAVVTELRQAVGDVGSNLAQEIGVFGYNDTFMSGVTYSLWLALVAVLCAMALWFGSWRHRIALGLLVAAHFGLLVGVDAYIRASTGGFGAQGRYLLPVGAGIPLLAADALAASKRRDLMEGLRVALLTIAGLLLAGVHLLCWWANARRYAVGRGGRHLFILQPDAWRPPAGWWPWLTLAVAGTVLLAAGLLAATATTSQTNRMGGHDADPAQPHRLPPVTPAVTPPS